jgi:serine phosphatase RsbU (regulator of sigma subunit)/tetratricopeptide (TPR) repeat protein
LFKLSVIIVRARFSIVLLFFLVISNLKSYSNIDSLKTILRSANGEKKVIILSQLCFQYVMLNNDSSLRYGEIGLDLSRKSKFKNHEASILTAMGNSYFDKGNYGKALESYIGADKIYEILRDENGIIQVAMNMGLVYDEQNLFDKALEQYNIVLIRAKALGNKKSYADCLNLLGGLYYQKDDFKALKYWEEALEIYKVINDTDGIMTCLGNIAVIYQERGNYDKALSNLKIYLSYRKKAQDKKGIVAAFHNIALVYKDKKDYPNAISYLDSCVFIGKKISDFGDLIETYHTLHEIYRDQNKLDKALKYYELSAMAKDSLQSQTQNNQLIEMSTKYGTEKKETENKLLNQQIELKNVESSRQQIAIILIVIILGIVGFVVFILIRQNRIKQKVNSELAEKNHIIEEQHKDITDSIQYSKRIQEAIMPPIHLWETTLPDSFLLYKPKDVLSGDFYWMEKTKDAIYFAACDCTGHGVPGAMVSVICSTALNRAVKEFGLKDTGQILNKVRELVLETFEKSEDNVQDGMDISLCSLNTKTLSLTWSGANNPLWYLDKGEPKEITATKQPIGKVDNPVPFATHTIQLNKNDIIYVFTDGYADQFGGPKGKKFKYKQLKELLVNNANKTMKEQRESLLNAFENWKGNLEQVDDVCVIGVRV